MLAQRFNGTFGTEASIKRTLRSPARMSFSGVVKILPSAMAALPSKQHGTTVPSLKTAICWRSPWQKPLSLQYVLSSAGHSKGDCTLTYKCRLITQFFSPNSVGTRWYSTAAGKSQHPSVQAVFHRNQTAVWCRCPCQCSHCHPHCAGKHSSGGVDVQAG